MDWMPQAVRDGILAVLFVSGPIVLLAASLGLVVGILQAATQVQEQTLGSAVKILGVFLTLIVGGFWMYQYLSKFTSSTIDKAFRIVTNIDTNPVPPRPRSIKRDDEQGNAQFPFRQVLDPDARGFDPSSRAPNLAGASQEPDLVPVNEGRIPPELSSSVPARPEAEPNIATQELQQEGLQNIVDQLNQNLADREAEEAVIRQAQADAERRAAEAQEAEQRAAEQARQRAEAEQEAAQRAAEAASPAPTPAPTPAPAPARQVVQEETPAEPVARRPRKRLERSSVGNITDRIKNSIDEFNEDTEGGN